MLGTEINIPGFSFEEGIEAIIQGRLTILDNQAEYLWVIEEAARRLHRALPENQIRLTSTFRQVGKVRCHQCKTCLQMPNSIYVGWWRYNPSPWSYRDYCPACFLEQFLALRTPSCAKPVLFDFWHAGFRQPFNLALFLQSAPDPKVILGEEPYRPSAETLLCEIVALDTPLVCLEPRYLWALDTGLRELKKKPVAWRALRRSREMIPCASCRTPIPEYVVVFQDGPKGKKFCAACFAKKLLENVRKLGEFDFCIEPAGLLASL